MSSGNINHSLSHRGMTFSIVRETQGDDAASFRWTVLVEAGSVGGLRPGEGSEGEATLSGVVEGRKAFARAHQAAILAIDGLLGARAGK